MGSCKATAYETAANSIEKLSGLFYDRLQTERLQFAVLSAVLAASEGNSVSIFADIRFRAHKLKGVAAIFDYLNLAAAADAVERASAEATRTQADHGDPPVWAALQALVELLGDLDDGGPRVPLLGTGEYCGQPAQ